MRFQQLFILKRPVQGGVHLGFARDRRCLLRRIHRQDRLQRDSLRIESRVGMRNRR